MTSFRLKFINVDLSAEAVVNENAVKGFMVVRARKGTTEPMYFDSGNTALIESMFGLGGADYPDIDEAIAFNKEYGIYISAPSGTSKDYASYYGGFYVTKNGDFPFYQVSDKDNPNFLTEITLGSELALGALSTPIVEVADLPSQAPGEINGQGVIVIKNIAPQVISSLNKLRIDFWGSDYTGCKKGDLFLGVKEDKVYYYLPSGMLSERAVGTCVRDLANGGTYTITLGTENISESDRGYPFFDFKKLIDYKNEYDETKNIAPNTVEILKEIIANGGSAQTGFSTFENIKGIADRISWIADVQKDTYFYIVQKSQTENVTNVKITSIGYDKYKYDLGLEFIENFNCSDDLILNNLDNLIAVFNDATQENPSGIYQKQIVVKEDGSQEISWVNVTEEYETKYVKILTPHSTNISMDNNVTASYKNTIRYVSTNSSGVLDLCEVGEDLNYKPVKNIAYNSLSIEVSEEIYPGSQTSGGSFTGSLDEEGTDEYGSNIYWGEILPDDAYSFIEVVPVKTFDADVDSNGMFKGTRIFDLYDTKLTNDNFTQPIQGQRFICKVVEDNKASGMTGGTWTDIQYTIIKEGWNEAALDTFDDVSVFMEPTGCNNLKGTLASLRTTHPLSTIISKRILTNSEYLNPNKIVVAGRMEGTAQYVGEFLMKDPWTYKKYYVCPIGDIGVNLCRIIENRLGGAAPAGVNETGGIGGQLNRAVLEAKYNFDNNFQKVCNEKGINPICYGPKTGLVLMGQRTTLDISAGISDYAYLVHTMAFDLCRREIKDDVMIPQLFKPIDDYYMNLRKQQVEYILNKRTQGDRPIWTAAICKIDNSNNTAATKARRDFQIEVRVKVTVVSEYVTLTFVNVGQSVQL